MGRQQTVLISLSPKATRVGIRELATAYKDLQEENLKLRVQLESVCGQCADALLEIASLKKRRK